MMHVEAPDSRRRLLYFRPGAGKDHWRILTSLLRIPTTIPYGPAEGEICRIIPCAGKLGRRQWAIEPRRGGRSAREGARGGREASKSVRANSRKKSMERGNRKLGADCPAWRSISSRAKLHLLGMLTQKKVAGSRLESRLAGITVDQMGHMESKHRWSDGRCFCLMGHL